jgi:intein/homing endonuclease
MVHPKTNRIHTSLNQTGSVTGRIASNTPNLQNIPIRTEVGQKIRRGFVSRPGWVFLAADYSQIELRILAHVTRDEALVEAFRQDQDIHRATAAAVYNIPFEAVTFNQRRFAKCVAAGTLVYTADGLRPIETFAENMEVGEYRPVSLQVMSDEGWQCATHLYYGGQQPVYQIKVASGFTLTCTPRHRIRVIDEQGNYVWRYAEELGVGDYVVMLSGVQAGGFSDQLPLVEFPADMEKTNFRDIELPVEWSPELARFLGYLISEGYIYRHPRKKYMGQITISQGLVEEKVVSDIEHVTQFLFGNRVKFSTQRGSRFAYLNSSKLIYWLQAIGISGGSAEKTIPDCLLIAPPLIQREFLKALFTEDGSIKNHGHVLTYSTKSPALAARLQQMLLNLGYLFSLYGENRRDYPETYYVLRLGVTRDVNRFLNDIGFVSPRKQIFAKAIHKDHSEIPHQKSRLQEIYPLLSGITREKVYEILRPNAPVRLNAARAGMVVKYFEEKGLEHPSVAHLKELTRPGFCYQKITEIEAEFAEVYDLVVPGNHTYIANGLVSHNTVNFGIIYGMGAYRLARDSELTLAEADKYIADYFKKFPGIRQYLDRTKEQARKQGYVETLLGRRRYFPIFKVTGGSSNQQAEARAEREAINHPIQGTAADIVKYAMIQLHEKLTAKYRARMIVQVHDELLIEAPEEEVEEVKALVEEVMCNAFALSVPLKVEASVGRNWLEIKG